MNGFQFLAILLGGILVIWDALALMRGRTRQLWRAVRILVCITACAVIAYADSTHVIAKALGINRGADLVFYSFILITIFMMFAFYARYRRVTAQITQLTRELALRDPQFGDESEPAE